MEIKGSNMKNKYQELVNKWENQADKSNNEQEQMWMHACAADLNLLIYHQSKLPNRKCIINNQCIEEFYSADRFVVYINNRRTNETYPQVCGRLISEMLSTYQQSDTPDGTDITSINM